MKINIFCGDLIDITAYIEALVEMAVLVTSAAVLMQIRHEARLQAPSGPEHFGNGCRVYKRLHLYRTRQQRHGSTSAALNTVAAENAQPPSLLRGRDRIARAFHDQSAV